jgi:hypothetical protein
MGVGETDRGRVRPRRLLLDRLLRRVIPSFDPGFAPAPAPLREGLWAVDRRMRLFGALVPCRTVVARVRTDELVVISAPALASRCAAELRKLGRVAAVVAPNSFHHLFAAETLAEFPSARLFVPPGLPERVPGLPPALVLERGTGSPWAPDLEHEVFGPVRGVSELVFHHSPSRSIFLTDLGSNLVRHERPIDRWLSRAYGLRAEFAPGRNARTLLRADRDESRRALRKILAWPFEAIVVGHGEPLEKDARERFAKAFAEFLT